MKKFVYGVLLGIVLGAIGYAFVGPNLRDSMGTATEIAGEKLQDVGRDVESTGKSIR